MAETRHAIDVVKVDVDANPVVSRAFKITPTPSPVRRTSRRTPLCARGHRHPLTSRGIRTSVCIDG